MSFPEAAEIADDIVSYVQANHPGANPMDSTAAMAIALGAMVATLNEMGLTKQGRTGALLDHLFKIAESTAVSGSGA